jgi:hypothetical protein
VIARTLSLHSARTALLSRVESDAALVYPHPSFIDFLVLATGGTARVIVCEQAGEVRGALPYLTLEAPGIGRVINSLPWWGSHGGCVLDPHSPDACEIRRQLLEHFKAELSGPDLLSATVILPHVEEAHSALYNSILLPAAMDHRIGQITELPWDARTDESLMGTFSQKTRNLVRKSLKQGFTEQVDDGDAAWDYLHRIHTHNIEVLGGTPKPRSHFESMRTTLPADMRRLSLAMDGETPVAALLVLYGGRTVEYVTPAVDVSARSRQPLSFLIWQAMVDALGRGMKRWNWGGTWIAQHSLHRFKAGFGAQDHRYSYFVVAREDGIATLRAYRAQLGRLFPYFYTYPYASLDTNP